MEALKQEMESEVVTSIHIGMQTLQRATKFFLLCNGTQYPTNVTQNYEELVSPEDLVPLGIKSPVIWYTGYNIPGSTKSP